MRPIVIICGQDRTGKSTLVNQLANHFGPGAIKHHSGSPPKLEYPHNFIWEENNYFSLMNAFNKIATINAVIVDRFHLGCPVFGKRYRNYPNDLHVDRLERYMDFNDNTFLILLTDHPEAIMSRDDGLSFEKTVADFAFTAESFKTEFNMSVIPNKLYINITENGGFVNTLPSVLKFIESKQ